MSKKNLFTQVEMTKISSNTFDLSHDVKLSLKMGDLVPIMCTECVPGDKFHISCESLIRFAPLVAPVMQRFDVTMHYFFVPNRLLWGNWENYITNTKVAGVLPSFPYLLSDGNTPTDFPLMNYLGIPRRAGATVQDVISALPFAAYQMIYNEYYRDQNLIAPSAIFATGIYYPLTDGNNMANYTNLYPLRKRAWEHDYFTSCLPDPQKGDPVNIPIGSQKVILDPTTTNSALTRDAATQTLTPAGGPFSTGLGGVLLNDDTGGVPTVIDPNDTLITENLGEATTITDLRRAFKLQEWLEKAMRGGSRYIEFIRSMFGVQSSDKRLQRPEYITGVKSPVVISEVLNTTGTDDSPQGSMAGHGVSVVSGQYGSYYCEEHGYIIGIMSILPKTAYQQGIPKHFLKTGDPFEYYFEQFAHIGEQAVKNKEIYAYQAAGAGDETFGYIPRYSEYKFENNRVAGDFCGTLDFWHDGRIFATPPALNQEFIECVPDTRIFAVEDGTDYIWAHVYNKVKASRKMAFFGSPKF